MEPLRIGVLGAARISELSIVDPAAATGTRLVAVAARSRDRAETFAQTYGIERVHDSYADVIADREVEAIYNPLANSLHAPWNKAAILAGKHVLTEKPFASNATEAAQVRDLAQGRSLVLFEGFHYLYHPLMQRLMSLLSAGELGTLQRVESTMFMSAPAADDPRWSLVLAGGALMDLGCYALHAQRVLGDFAGGEPRLVGATGAERAGAPCVDEWVDAHLEFPSGATGLARCSMTSDHWDMSLRVVGTTGEAFIPDFLYQRYDDRIIITSGSGERTEHCGETTSYTYQLQAFINAVRDGAAYRTDADDAVATMSLIDDCYRTIGLEPRPSSADITDTKGVHPMPQELLATCWTHAGDAVPVAGRHLSPLDLRVRAEAAAAAGFTGIGFTINDLEAARATYGLPQVKRICDDLGLVHLEVELLENWWTTGRRRRESDQTRMSLLTAAEVLGARQIKIGPDVEVVDGAVPPLADVAHWAAELHQLAIQAAEVGTRVALEPLPFSNITDFRLAAELVAAADHPAAGLVVDIWHLERGPSTLTDLAEIPGDKVFVVELNDAPAPQSSDLFHDTIHHRVLCGSGTFDVAGFIETLQRIGFDGPWGVEIISEAHRGRPLQEALVDAYRTTMAVFDSMTAGTEQTGP